MAENVKRQFLDYAGLAQFWGIIDAKFATKSVAAKVDSFKVVAGDADANSATSRTITYTDSAVSGNKTYNIVLPCADSENGYAGLMSASQAEIVDTIEDKINMAAPFHGLELNGAETARDAQRHANIGLKFVPEGTGNDRKAYIDLVDLNYPSEGTWNSIEEAAYDANNPSHAVLNGAYYAWSIAGAAGPRNNMDEPLLNKPVSRIDVSELVKAGLLQEAEVVLHLGKPHLKLTFITTGDGTDADRTDTTEVLINVADLVDVYTAGEGINMSTPSNNIDGEAFTNVINAKLAATEVNAATGLYDMGSVRLGYETDAAKQLYKLETDTNGNAFVAVPWEHTNVVITTPSDPDAEGANADDFNPDGEPYLVVTNTTSDSTDANGIKTTTYAYDIKVGEGLKKAEAMAKTSVQNVTVGAVSETDAVAGADTIGITKDAYLKVNVTDEGWGRNVVTELTDSAKASLGLADSAVQGIVTATKERGDEVDGSAHAGHAHTPSGNDLEVAIVTLDGEGKATKEGWTTTDGKGTKGVKVTLGAKTMASLDKADTAMQTITIMGTQLDIDDPVYERAEAELALGLGSAAGRDVVDAIPTVGTGAEGALVDADFKTEVDDKDVTGQKEARYTVATTKAVKTYVDDRIDSLDQDSRDYVDSRINALDTLDTPDASKGEKPHVVNAKTTAAYDYTADKYAGEEGFNGQSEMILTQIGQTDGILDRAKTKTAAIGIQDIYDFAPLSAADITAICSVSVQA